MEVIVDTETNALSNYTKLWCVVCKEVETGEVRIFTHKDDFIGFEDYSRTVGSWVGHNVIGFDYNVLMHFFPRLGLDSGSLRDTLVLSRLLNFSIVGGHSLEAWGERLGRQKTTIADFSVFSEDILERCVGDVEINYKLWQKFKLYCNDPNFKDAIELEHKAAVLCREMENNGFGFDIETAKRLEKDLAAQLTEIDKKLETAFPPKPVAIQEITPKETKHGTLSLVNFKWLGDSMVDLTCFTAGVPFTRIGWRPFNPRSPSQIVERLNDAGWKPFEKTKGHIDAERKRNHRRLEDFRKTGWTVSEANLATLPATAPEAARSLARRILLESRRSDLEEWIGLYNAATCRIHGQFLSIGAWTHRFAHRLPNTGNIASAENVLGQEMRSLWQATEGNALIGVDAEGIQLRVLAHWMDDKAFTEALVNGDKDKKTDAHSLNAEILGCSRSVAKTFIYAWLLGAGIDRIAHILDTSRAKAKEAAARFVESYPGLKRLKTEIIPQDAARGYMKSLDKRLILCDNTHKMLAGYLQSGEAIIMKKAASLWRERLTKEGIQHQLVNFVHDEFITEAPDDKQLLEYIMGVQIESIVNAGELLELKCPLSGSGKIGYNWYEIH